MPECICPHCKQSVHDDDAIRCLYCGESLNRSIGFMGGIKYPPYKIIIIIAVILVLASFIALIIR